MPAWGVSCNERSILCDSRWAFLASSHKLAFLPSYSLGGYTFFRHPGYSTTLFSAPLCSDTSLLLLMPASRAQTDDSAQLNTTHTRPAFSRHSFPHAFLVFLLLLSSALFAFASCFFSFLRWLDDVAWRSVAWLRLGIRLGLDTASNLIRIASHGIGSDAMQWDGMGWDGVGGCFVALWRPSGFR